MNSANALSGCLPSACSHVGIASGVVTVAKGGVTVEFCGRQASRQRRSAVYGRVDPTL